MSIDRELSVATSNVDYQKWIVGINSGFVMLLIMEVGILNIVVEAKILRDVLTYLRYRL